MNIEFVDLKAQYLSLKEEIDSAVADVFDNTAFIGGKNLKSFEDNFRSLLGIDHCVPCGNGTDALYIVMKMLGIGVGDEVITTASSWISTSETITQTGARPVFVDIDEYYTIDVQKIEAKITPQTKAILPVHLYGQMCDMPEIMRIAGKHDLRVIEDCAQSHLSSFEGKYAGLWGDAGTFSFYPGKNLGAYGDAGCIITNDESLAKDCRCYANHGALVKHHHEIEGINSRMDGIQAAVLNVKLPHLQEWTRRRAEVAENYMNGLKGINGVELPKIRPKTEHSFHVLGIKVDHREALQAHLKEKGIPTQIHYPRAMPFMKAYSYLEALPEQYPNAYDLQNRELSLPIYPELKEWNLEIVTNEIRNFFNEYMVD